MIGGEKLVNLMQELERAPLPGGTGIDLFDPSHPFRASDHDPVLVGLNLTADAGTTPVNPVTTLTASPAALTVTAGGAAVSSTLTTSTQNYSGADLTVTITTPAGVTVTPSATTVSPNGTFTVSVTAPEGTPAGTYPVTVTTTGDNGLKASTDLNVTVGTGGGTTTPTVGKLVISEVYGGGGNNGATYTHDFIEIFNAGTTSVNLGGYSVQYTSASGTSWQVTPLTSVNLAPGQYYLVQQAFDFHHFGYGSALALLLFLIVLVLTVAQWQVRRKWVFYED